MGKTRKNDRKNEEMRWKADYYLSVNVKGCAKRGNTFAEMFFLIQSPIYYTVCGMPLASNSVIVAVAKTKTKTSTSTCPVILAILRLRPQTTFGRGFLFIENRKITFSQGQVEDAYPSAFRNTLINLLWEQVLLVFMHDTSTAINRLC